MLSNNKIQIWTNKQCDCPHHMSWNIWTPQLIFAGRFMEQHQASCQHTVIKILSVCTLHSDRVATMLQVAYIPCILLLWLNILALRHRSIELRTPVIFHDWINRSIPPSLTTIVSLTHSHSYSRLINICLFGWMHERYQPIDFLTHRKSSLLPSMCKCLSEGSCVASGCWPEEEGMDVATDSALQLESCTQRTTAGELSSETCSEMQKNTDSLLKQLISL